MVRLSELYMAIDDLSKAYQYFQDALTFVHTKSVK